ncbi:MAG: branched-chain amino acid ABC transporter permease [Desulfobacterales bacterium]|jgi:branched-chain amino acid transport system permease protein
MNLKSLTIILLIFVTLFLLGVPLIFGDYLVFVFSIICAYIIVAFGMNILCGYTGLISLGHQAFFGIGAYTVAILGSKIPGFPFVVALFLGGSISGLIGFFLGFTALRTSGVYLAIATIAFGMITGEVFNEWASLTGGANGLVVLPPALGSLQFESSTALYYLILGVTAVMSYFAINLVGSNTGRAFIAVRESEISAQSYGISLVKTKTVSFAISACYVGIAGGIYAYLIKYIAPIDFTILVGLEFVVIIVVGGLATISGSIIGAIILFSLPQIFASLAGWQELVTGGVLLVVILFLPEGLVGGLYRLTNHLRRKFL